MDSSLLFTIVAAAIGFFMLFWKFRFHQANITKASSLTLSSPSPSSSHKRKHHVFPSFHGPDVRKAFLSHVLKEFKRKQIDLFIDNNIERSKSIGPELRDAIRGSRIAILLLSKNYASSTWCMNELVEIMKCREVLGQTVMTVFYKVDPTDVKKQTGVFGNVFRKTCKGKSKEDIERWRHALEEVAEIAGHHSNKWVNEADMIQDIAIKVSNKLFDSMPSKDFDSLVGMRVHMEKLEPLLRPDLDEVRMIGILGPAGIGKSTIARFLYDRLSKNFQLSVFVENIKANYAIPPCSDNIGVKLNLQKQFMSQIFNHQLGIEIPHSEMVKDRLKDKQVFVVLDNVDRLEQLEAMANKTCWFGPWSRIIITTQDESLLRKHRINHKYRVGFPSSDEALEMFCMYAFGQNSPEDGFEELAREVTYFAGKLPLALQVMGSHFRGMTKHDWSMELSSLWTRLDGGIESILKLSHDALPDVDKNIFLHIACFFNYHTVDKVVEYLKKSFSDVKNRLRILAEKSLISVSTDVGRIRMHSLLVQLGKEIVRKQSVGEPWRPKFLVGKEDIDEVLTDDTANTGSVIGIELNGWDDYHINERLFEGMSNLQFLRISGYEHRFEGCLGYISPKLRLLHWDYFPLTCLPFIDNLEFLVELRMRHSKLEKLWDGIKPLPNLKWMDLSESKDLKDLSNISTTPNLQKLNLDGCSRLVNLPSCIGNAHNLQTINLGGCSSLVELPSSIGNAFNLQKINLSGCLSLVELPFSIGNAPNLQKINLERCSSLVELPSSIGNAPNLQKINLEGCSSLVELPSSIENATNLEELDLSASSNLVKLPFSIGNLPKLCTLRLKRWSKLEVLPTNVNLAFLTTLDLRDCSLLKSFPEISTNIKYLDLSGTSIEEVPSSIRSWSSLESLSMSYSEKLKEFPYALDSITDLHLRDAEIQEIGPWVRGFSRLSRLVLNNMQKLVSISELPDSLLFLDAENCESLERLDCSFSNPDIVLNFRKCFKLNQEARNLIIQTSTRQSVVLPGGEVPAYFTFRSSQCCLTVKLNEKPPRSAKFRACIMLVSESKLCGSSYLHCRITSKQNAQFSEYSKVYFLEQIFSEHLYIFEIDAMEYVPMELDFVFEFRTSEPINVRIKECGILPTFEGSC